MVVGVIPARYASTRFPGKALASLHGRPLLQWVYEQASRVRGLDQLLIATDDERIEAAAVGFGASVFRTVREHATGTDRLGEVLDALADRPEFLLNLQGDEPLLPVEAASELVASMQATPDAVWTLAAPLPEDEEFRRPSVVKVARAEDGRALYFSRAPIPHARADVDASGYDRHRLRHIGIYGFPRLLLRRYLDAPRSPLERIEELEQLRALEMGIPIRVGLARQGSPGVDTPEDLAWLEARYPTAAALTAAANEL